MVFDWFKKKAPPPLPLLRADMIHPTDKLLSTAEAKTLFGEWLVTIGQESDQDRSGRMELAFAVDCFADAIKERHEDLKITLAETKSEVREEIRDLKTDLRELKKDLAKCRDPADRAPLEQVIAATEKAIQTAPNKLVEYAAALEQFIADKRAFLIEYTNEQVHGPDWRSKL